MNVADEEDLVNLNDSKVEFKSPSDGIASPSSSQKNLADQQLSNIKQANNVLH